MNQEQQRQRRIIVDWMLFHLFYDDCDYPLISPSDVVLDDLQFRLGSEGDLYEIDKASRERWKTIRDIKGKERRLRRPAGLLNAHEIKIMECLTANWREAELSEGVSRQAVENLLDKLKVRKTPVNQEPVTLSEEGAKRWEATFNK